MHCYPGNLLVLSNRQQAPSIDWVLHYLDNGLLIVLRQASVADLGDVPGAIVYIHPWPGHAIGFNMVCLEAINITLASVKLALVNIIELHHLSIESFPEVFSPFTGRGHHSIKINLLCTKYFTSLY